MLYFDLCSRFPCEISGHMTLLKLTYKKLAIFIYSARLVKPVNACLHILKVATTTLVVVSILLSLNCSHLLMLRAWPNVLRLHARMAASVKTSMHQHTIAVAQSVMKEWTVRKVMLWLCKIFLLALNEIVEWVFIGTNQKLLHSDTSISLARRQSLIHYQHKGSHFL